MKFYSKTFFKALETTRYSAEMIVPLVMELVSPKSVVDVGCGTGVWLSTFQKNGVTDVLGIDGPWVSEKLLEIPVSSFLRKNLEKPISLDKKFDLAMSLEVAEHLAPQTATTFVDSLTSLADVVLFSAAVPNQGGVHHINEQWQKYWVNLFEQKGYVAIDAIRMKIWETERIPPYYKQNILLFVKKEVINNYPDLVNISQGFPPSYRLVHPNYTDPSTMSLRRYIQKLPYVVFYFIKRKFSVLRRLF